MAVSPFGLGTVKPFIGNFQRVTDHRIGAVLGTSHAYRQPQIMPGAIIDV